MYSVSSYFYECVLSRTTEPLRIVTIGGSDYTDRVMKFPTIRRTWDGVKPQSLTIEFANDDQGMNFIRDNKTNLANTCAIQFGYNHVDSGDELITLYSGTMDKVRYYRGKCSITLLDKFKQLSERMCGTQEEPVTFTDSTLPSDIAWTAITSYGGYSAIQSDTNPDIDYTSFSAWSSVFSDNSVYMNGHLEGIKCTEVLKTLARYTNSAIYIESDKIAFKRFTAADSVASTLSDDNILDLELSIDDEDIVNKQYVYGKYDVDSRDWYLQVSDEISSSISSYGLREQIEKDEKIWYVNSASALNLAQTITSMAGEPYDRVSVDTTLVGALRQIGETITVVDDFHGINNSYRVMGYQLDLDKGLFNAEIDKSQLLHAFTLDVSTLDGTDVLL